MEHIRIRAFRAVDDPRSCVRYIYEHELLLKEIGVSSALPHDDRWCLDDRTIVVLAEHPQLGIIGGLRLQQPSPNSVLPIQLGLGKQHPGVGAFLEEARQGTAELCGLWNARRFSGRGLPWLMTSMAVAVAPSVDVKQVLCLAADYSMKYPMMNGFQVVTQVGDEGAFKYPLPEFTSYLLCHSDTSAVVAGDLVHFRRLNELRAKDRVVRMEMVNKEPLWVTYDLDVAGTAAFSSMELSELRRTA